MNFVELLKAERDPFRIQSNEFYVVCIDKKKWPITVGKIYKAKGGWSRVDSKLDFYNIDGEDGKQWMIPSDCFLLIEEARNYKIQEILTN